MGTEIKVWQVRDNRLDEIEERPFSDDHYEADLEGWIERDTSLLGSKLLVIGRQHDLPTGGCLDLLCIDETGTLVLVEFKRDSSSRETIAQILDYASWLDNAGVAEIETCALHHLDKPLADAFSDCFEDELQGLTPQKHRMLVVAPKLDTAAERMINYLAERHGMNINAIFFRHAKIVGGDEILIRTVLVPDSPSSEQSYRMPEGELMDLARQLQTVKLVTICRQVPNNFHESKPTKTYGGSFRYWFEGKLVLGINVAGQRRNPPPGELDVWTSIPNISQITSISDTELRQRLERDFTVFRSGRYDVIIRLKSEEDARKLVALVRDWSGRITTTAASSQTTATAAE